MYIMEVAMPIRYSSRELIELITQNGWMLKSVRGSHHKFTHPEKPGVIIIAHPKKNVPPGTAAQILKAAGIKPVA